MKVVAVITAFVLLLIPILFWTPLGILLSVQLIGLITGHYGPTSFKILLIGLSTGVLGSIAMLVKALWPKLVPVHLAILLSLIGAGMLCGMRIEYLSYREHDPCFRLFYGQFEIPMIICICLSFAQRKFRFLTSLA